MRRLYVSLCTVPEMAHFFKRLYMRKSLSRDALEKIQSELGELDRRFVEINGKRLKPSQCYRFEVDPAHILFNTNCPDGLKKQIQSILNKYFRADETGT